MLIEYDKAICMPLNHCTIKKLSIIKPFNFPGLSF